MWKSWGKSSSKLHSPSHFRCSSFKDIESLCLNGDFQPEEHQIHTLQAPRTKKNSIFHRVRTASSLLRHWPGRPESELPTSASTSTSPSLLDTHLRPVLIPGSESRIVLYFTSLRVVRPTFEACRSVQLILQGFRVAIDERDVSMDSGFMEELQLILGGKEREKLTLPRVFIGGRYVGGAEEVKQLHEIGELKKLIEGLPAVEHGGGCNACGGYKFVLCTECSGSHKVYSDKVGFRSCMACNENGLVRCPSCSCPPPF